MDKKDKKEIMYKEIDLIQNCITRMAQNSLMVKGWLISLVAVVFALLPEKFDIYILCVVGCVIVLVFWYLDAFFLKAEKLYRMKYNWVIKHRLNSDAYIFDLNPYNENMWIRDKNKMLKTPSIGSCMFSKTLLPMYLPFIIFIAIVFFGAIGKNPL